MVAGRGGTRTPASWDSTITPYAARRYIPHRKRDPGIALALSGGGFRSALFHLGAMRRLNEVGVLSRLVAIASVSGGSILSAHLATQLRPWPPPGTILDEDEWERRVAAPFRAFCARDLRTGPLLRRLLPRGLASASRALEGRYREALTGLGLRQLPDRPRFIYLATDLSFGIHWSFEKSRVGSWQAGYARAPAGWPLARAVAASSCFPPLFDPMPIGLGPDQLTGGLFRGDRRDALVRALRLTDGGVYDNLGLEPVWQDYATVLSSDGGATFDYTPILKLRQEVGQYVGIQSEQAPKLRKRWLISNLDAGVLRGTYWGIGSNVARYGMGRLGGYGESLVDHVVSEVRTDLDAFSPEEQGVLENHGYFLAEAAIRRHAAWLVDGAAHPFRVPHQGLLKESVVRRGLAASHKRRILGRGRWRR